MSYSKTSMNLSFNIWNLLSIFDFPSHKSTQQKKIHDYSKFVSGIDYILETLQEPLKACMTGFGKDIKPGDYLLLLICNKSDYYQIEEIDYYSDPSDMWIASLQKLPNKD
jgi:MioC protein